MNPNDYNFDLIKKYDTIVYYKQLFKYIFRQVRMKDLMVITPNFKDATPIMSWGPRKKIELPSNPNNSININMHIMNKFNMQFRAHFYFISQTRIKFFHCKIFKLSLVYSLKVSEKSWHTKKSCYIANLICNFARSFIL